MRNSRINIKSATLFGIIIALLFIGSLVLFAFITHEIVFEKEEEFDQKAFQIFSRYSNPVTIEISKILAFFGSPYFFIPAYVVIMSWLFFEKRKREALQVFIIAVTSTILLHSLKAIFGRRRPDLPLFEELTNNSFPSGHALSSFIFCAVLIAIIWKGSWRLAVKIPLCFLLLSWSLAIGISRIILRYHYASDVLAGFLVGFAWVIIAFYIQTRLNKGSHRFE
jgi:undecaprenyl-diphosphatase